jgi:hypothetical protein
MAVPEEGVEVKEKKVPRDRTDGGKRRLGDADENDEVANILLGSGANPDLTAGATEGEVM